MSKVGAVKSTSNVRRFKAYPAYKESGVDWIGMVPEKWELKRLKYVFWLSRGVDLSSDNFVEGPYPVCASNGIIGYHDKFTTKGPSIIVGRSGSVGEVNYIDRNFWAHNTALFVMHFYTVIPRYCYYLLLKMDLKSLSAGTAVGTLNRNYIHDSTMAVPSIVEQESIAAFLDHETTRIDQLIAKKERQIELLQEKRAALISHAVTKGLNPKAKMKDSGIEWLGKIPEHWKLIPLKRLLTQNSDAIKTGPFGSQLLSSEMLSGEVKVYNQRNIIDKDFDGGENYITVEKYAELKAFAVMHGDILVTTRGTIGRCALFPDDAEEGILHPCLMRIQADQCKLLREYLAMLIQDGGIVQLQLSLMSNATTIAVIYSETLKNVLIPTPPIGEQKSILSKINEDIEWIENLSGKVTTSIEKLQEYRTAIISAAVTGKIDVREEVA